MMDLGQSMEMQAVTPTANPVAVPVAPVAHAAKAK
jgi:hypothetical protein